MMMQSLCDLCMLVMTDGMHAVGKRNNTSSTAARLARATDGNLNTSALMEASNTTVSSCCVPSCRPRRTEAPQGDPILSCTRLRQGWPMNHILKLRYVGPRCELSQSSYCCGVPVGLERQLHHCTHADDVYQLCA
jgi:hypothetical protein